VCSTLGTGFVYNSLNCKKCSIPDCAICGFYPKGVQKCLFCHGKFVDPKTGKCGKALSIKDAAMGGQTSTDFYCKPGFTAEVFKGKGSCVPDKKSKCAKLGSACLKCVQGKCTSCNIFLGYVVSRDGSTCLKNKFVNTKAGSFLSVVKPKPKPAATKKKPVVKKKVAQKKPVTKKKGRAFMASVMAVSLLLLQVL
jgi:hypothetical protein